MCDFYPYYEGLFPLHNSSLASEVISPPKIPETLAEFLMSLWVTFSDVRPQLFWTLMRIISDGFGRLSLDLILMMLTDVLSDLLGLLWSTVKSFGLAIWRTCWPLFFNILFTALHVFDIAGVFLEGLAGYVLIRARNWLTILEFASVIFTCVLFLFGGILFGYQLANWLITGPPTLNNSRLAIYGPDGKLTTSYHDIQELLVRQFDLI